MSLDIFFHKDVSDRLFSLAQANDRALALALRFGADPQLARLAWEVYAGALSDAAVAFGLALAIPKRKEVRKNGRQVLEPRGPVGGHDG